jgi:hypothetical protein
MTSSFSLDSVPLFRRREEQDFRHVPSKKKSRLDRYQTAKSGEGSDEAGNDKKQIPQCSIDRQGTGQSLLSIEMLAGLFSDLELKAASNQSNHPITRRQVQYLTRLKIDASPFDKRLATKFLNHVRARRGLGLASIWPLCAGPCAKWRLAKRSTLIGQNLSRPNQKPGRLKTLIKNLSKVRRYRREREFGTSSECNRGSVKESAAALQPDRITTDRAQKSKCKNQSHYSTPGKTRN